MLLNLYWSWLLIVVFIDIIYHIAGDSGWEIYVGFFRVSCLFFTIIVLLHKIWT